jgi:predicted tellurium resistance membrane protein TerC
MLEFVAGFITLTILEIVLGIDNMLVIAILSGRLPKEKRRRAQITGLSIAMITRVLLLCSISWLTGLTATVFAAGSLAVSWRDMILFAGGLFLLWKSVHGIHQIVEVEAEHEDKKAEEKAPSMGFFNCIVQIVGWT